MKSLFWNTEDFRRNLTGGIDFLIEKQLSQASDAFAAYSGDFPQWGGSREVAHFGTAYKMTPKNQIDFHFGFGLAHATANRVFGVGYSFRIDNVWKRQ